MTHQAHSSARPKRHTGQSGHLVQIRRNSKSRPEFHMKRPLKDECVGGRLDFIAADVARKRSVTAADFNDLKQD